MLQTSGSAKAMAAVMAVKLLVTILLGPVSGTLADRSDRRRLMWAMDGARGLLVLGIAWLVETPGSPFAAVLALTALVAAATQLRTPAYSASVVHIVGREQVQQAEGVSQVANTVAQVMGPLLGGAVVAAAGGWTALLCDALSFFVSAGCVWAAGPFPSPIRQGRHRPPFWTDLTAGFAYIGDHPLARALVVLAPVLNFFGNAIGVLLPVLAVKVWRVSPVEFGVFEAAFPLGFTLGGLAIMAMGKRLRRRGWWMSGAIIGGGPLIALMGLSAGVWTGVPFLVVAGVTVAFANVLLGTALRTEINPEVQGRVSGTLSSLTNVASPLAVMAAGVVGDAYGAVPVTVAAGLAQGVLGVVGVAALPGLRDYD